MAAASDGWSSVRQEACRRRAALLGDDSSDTDAETTLAAAIRAAGLDCHARPPDDALLSGAHAVLDTEAEAIWFRSDLPPETRRLIIAHELAHLWLHHTEDGETAHPAEAVCRTEAVCRCAESDFEEPETATLVGYGPRERGEIEANIFAREFLLPTALLRRWFWEEGLSADAIAERAGLPAPAVRCGRGGAGGGRPNCLRYFILPPLSHSVGEGVGGRGQIFP